MSEVTTGHPIANASSTGILVGPKKLGIANPAAPAYSADMSASGTKPR